MLGISVIVCSYNPRADYFQRALDGLRGQTLANTEWELLVIDNASKESLADKWDLSWHPHGRHIREDSKGKMAAISRGINEARADLIVFVDDDNVVDATFLQCAMAISRRYPYLGVFGAGKIEPAFEVQPPSELIPRRSLLAVRNVSSALWSNNLEDWSCYPWGAGMCVTRQVADSYRRLIEKLNVSSVIGPRADRLFRGDDDLFSYAAVLSGKGFGIFPELQLTHLISARRLHRSHFLRLINDHAFSHGVLRCLLGGTQPRRMNVVSYLRLILHGLRNGQFSARCQWAASRGEDSAARFTAENRLPPVDLSNLLPYNPHNRLGLKGQPGREADGLAGCE